ncbi:unnamed protein product [Adineta ricciae]|uniref:Uncharacterized protein n=1 Tax=Adineta ricciae TaxID=249248 RepID=A0A815JZT2_ADIRI|nr:unnamed protein product [Adineta ricciae]CAF1500298.1 unnamed protein product [Adineta ricciae]
MASDRNRVVSGSHSSDIDSTHDAYPSIPVVFVPQPGGYSSDASVFGSQPGVNRANLRNDLEMSTADT